MYSNKRRLGKPVRNKFIQKILGRVESKELGLNYFLITKLTKCVSMDTF